MATNKEMKREAQGKAGSPLMTHVRRVARHEAGHFVVARALGFTTTGIAVTMLTVDGGHSGEAAIEVYGSAPAIEDVTSYLRRRIAVLYAGAIAEASAAGVVDQANFEQCLREGGANDKLKIGELIQLLRNIVHPAEREVKAVESQLHEIDTECIQIALRVIEQNSQAIDDVAQAVCSKFAGIGDRISLSDAELAALPTVAALALQRPPTSLLSATRVIGERAGT